MTSQKTSALCLVLSTALVYVVASGTTSRATAQSGALVRLQPSQLSPIQTGHAAISGSMRAGSFAGNGTSLTNLSVSNLSGVIGASHFPVPFSLSGSVTGVVGVGNFENSASSTTALALHGKATGMNGIAVFAEASNTSGGTIGLKAQASGDIGSAVYALATGVSGYAVLANSSAGTLAASLRANNDNPVGTAIRASAELNGGTGVYSQGDRGGYFYGTTLGLEVRGALPGSVGIDASAGNSTSAVSVGVRGRSNSPTGIGVHGINNVTSGVNIGVLGEANGASGRGVFGSVDFANGMTYGGRFETSSSDGRGVYGYASTTGASDNPYGVRGQASTATTGFALYAVGDLGASGLKPFRIDHPGDPLNKYLLHYASESPFPQNFYCGNVVTDDKGYAWVVLPDYFADINANYKYSLTVVDDADSDDFTIAKVSKEIKGNRFQIRTSTPSAKVSWRIDADRNDDRVKFNRPTDVREKTGAEKGKYQHPEYLGAPANMGMDYAPKPRVGSSPKG